jgi:hypothetical protein
MKNNVNNFGKNAGKIWKALEKFGPLDEVDLIKKIKLNRNDFYAGIGWLARENKIYKVGSKYHLGETNLTNNIGYNAGKVWNTLYTTQDVNITTIAEISQIKIRDAYHALGWLAREDKIQTTQSKPLKFRLK